MRQTAALAQSLAPATPLRAAPFIKWVGGKSRLLAQLSPLLPAGVERMRHVEPFAGGAAMFFHRAPARALLADVNPDLVNTYSLVRDDVESVIRALHRLARTHSVDRYYEIRSAYNERRARTPSERAAQFVYLNKTCFNGLHRVNRRGEFNVPAGRYTNPRIVDEHALRAASGALATADIRCSSFEALIEYAQPGDFVYLDPPYVPMTNTANFTAYANDGFDYSAQQRLRDVVRVLDRRRCKVMLSNSDVPIVRDLYREFRIDQVFAPRAVSCDPKSRGPIAEVVVRNYE